jgi:hypothetical protein
MAVDGTLGAGFFLQVVRLRDRTSWFEGLLSAVKEGCCGNG